MNIFILGASGFLGRHVVRELLKKERIQKIYCLIHNSELPIEDDRIVKVKGSVESLDKLRILDGIDKCIIMSAVLDGKNTTAEMTMRVNYEGVVSAIAYCRKNQISKICLISSVNVNLGRQGAYAKSKSKAEKAVKESGLTYLILRPALIFGADAKGGLKVIEDFITKYGIVPVFGDGNKKEQPIHVDECAKFIAYYLLDDSWDRTIELYGKDAMTYNRMCHIIAGVKGKKARLLHFPVGLCVFGLHILKLLHVKFPIDIEQIYHIDTDLSGDMDEVYRETNIFGDSFASNLRKGREQ